MRLVGVQREALPISFAGMQRTPTRYTSPRHGEAGKLGGAIRDNLDAALELAKLGYRPSFASKVLVTDGCWLWQGRLDKDGYGWFHYKSRRAAARAHRYAYQLVYGDIPVGMLVLHRCDTPACVRPSHLWVGTAKQNSQDMVAKGRNRDTAGELGPNTRLTDQQVRAIRAAYVPGVTLKMLGTQYGVSISAVSAVVNRKSWTHI